MSTSLSESSFWILSALAAGRRHGYGILQDVVSLSGGESRLKVPTLYASLERLEHSGLVATDGEEVIEGRARRYYVLTPDGRSALTAETARLEARVRVARERLASRTIPAHPMTAPA